MTDQPTTQEVRIPDNEVREGGLAMPDYGWYLLARRVKVRDVRARWYDIETNEMVFICDS